MKSVLNFVKNFIRKEQPKTLGRWELVYCNNKLNKKIDLSNEDHCGPCGQYNVNNKFESKVIEPIGTFNKKN